MTQNIKYGAIVGQIIFAWMYATATNVCAKKSCSANSYISFILILLALGIFDWYFLKFYPKFKSIPVKLFSFIVILFPVLLYLCGILLNALSKRSLSVLIIGLSLVIISRLLWMYLARGKFSQKPTEYFALGSLFLLILGIVFLIANLNFAISSYLKYKSPETDMYIVGNKGSKSSFLNYKFR